MELPFFPSPRSDALRSLAMADRLLKARNLLGSRSFAKSARNADSSLVDADQIIAIVETLLGAERRLVNNQPDWLAVLHLTPLEGLDAGLVSGRFHRLRSLLDPHTNRHLFAEEAYNLIHEAYNGWRSLYDAHLGLYNAPIAALPQNFDLFGGDGVAQQQLVQGGQSSISAQVVDDHMMAEKEEEDKVEEKRADSPVLGDGSTFWTACPYCYYMFEYPQVYVDCAMKCQTCKRVFHAVVITSPPPVVVVEGRESYHCSWPFAPMNVNQAGRG